MRDWRLRVVGFHPFASFHDNFSKEHHKVFHASISKMHNIVGLVLFFVSFTTVSARNDTILHGWHSESHERGTWSILWGCLATIFICTWSVLHLNVPPRSASDLKRFTDKVILTLEAMIAPEFHLANAIEDTLHSRILKKQLNRHVDRQQKREAWSWTHVRFLLADGFTKTTEDDDVWDPLDSETIFNIPQEPRISKKELKSRSSTDWIANTLAVLQISWFGAQLLVRRIQHLHNTALEILTLAFIVCSLFTFGFCWPLPQNVAYPVVLPPLEETPPESPDTTSPKAPLNTTSEDSPAIETISHKDEDRQNETARPLEHSASDGYWALDKSNKLEKRALNFEDAIERVTITILLLFAFAGAIFGGVHCLAWNSTFPTPKERLAWRVCSVATAALPIVAVSIALISRTVSTKTWGGWAIDDFVLLALGIPYTVARLTLIALALASLRAVPADVFQTTDWNNIIPHVGL